jgi:hypothetical protein
MIKPGETEFLIEYRVVGQSVKVSAVDPVTLTEVSIVGPVSAGRTELKRNAVRKLKYVLERDADKPSATRRRRGYWV